MSTKCTIACGEDFHLYNECFDKDGVYLELEGSPKFEVSPGSVMVRIPAHIWEAIRTFPGVWLEWADKSDAEIRAIVEKRVDERIAKWRQAKSKRQKALVSFAGGMVYGRADEPRAKQIRKGLQEMLRRRDLQRSIAQKAKQLIWENTPEGREAAAKQWRRDHPKEVRSWAAKHGWIQRRAKLNRQRLARQKRKPV